MTLANRPEQAIEQTATPMRLPRGAFCLTIAPGDPLPQPGSVVVLASPLADLVYRVIVRTIVRLEWEYAPQRRDEIVVGVRVWVRGEKTVEQA
jgi:hypothetical protein